MEINMLYADCHDVNVPIGPAKHKTAENYPTTFEVWTMKQNYGLSSTRVLIRDEFDTATADVLIEEEQGQPPFCSCRQGLAHNSALIF